MHPSWPHFDEEMIEAAARVLRSGRVNYLTGDEGRLFEREMADYIGCRHAVALANGTVALELALHALGISAGDEVIVPSRTFVATAMAVVRVGGVPVFADVDRESQNITAESIAAKWTTRTKAVVVVHLAGRPADMDPIMQLAHSRGTTVIEDCAQALGARYKGRPVGSFGDASAFSFCQDKILTTGGEGGMLLTNRDDVWQRAWSFKDHGKNFTETHTQHVAPGFRWLHDSIGTNWRLSEVQSAIGRVALRQLGGWISRRRYHAGILNDRLSLSDALRTTLPPSSSFHAYYKWYAFVRPEMLAAGWSRDRIIEEVNRRGVPCFSGSCSEIYLEKAFEASLRPRARHAVARELGETSLMLLVHPTLAENDVRQAAEVVRRVVDEATRSEISYFRMSARQLASA